MNFNAIEWKSYKESERGKEVILLFTESDSKSLQYDILNRFNPYQTNLFDKEYIRNYITQFKAQFFTDLKPLQEVTEARDFYHALINKAFVDTSDGKNSINYKAVIEHQSLLSFLFFDYYPELFIPNLFTYNTVKLLELAEAFKLHLPKTTKKEKYKERCDYYIDLCEELYFFKEEHELTPYELCAFIYDYAPTVIAENKTEETLPKALQAWFVNDFDNKKEKDLKLPYWCTNTEVKKGDILLFYQKGLQNAITHIATATRDAIIDPFTEVYSYTTRTTPISIPSITLQEMKQDVYLSAHPAIIKSFREPVSTLTYDEYGRVLELIKTKKGDLSLLPTL